MSILDDAIREHLDLKRAHGADEAELKKLEDEAFGPPVRPDEAEDPFAEAPTEFLSTPDTGGEEPSNEGSRRPDIADLQEAPPAAEETATEHEVVAEEPEDDGSHSTEERHAIAEQPTEFFDVEGDFDAAATRTPGPSDDELVDAEMAEPRLAPVDPLGEIDASATADEQEDAEDEDETEDDFDEFFSEQRLSEELSQALEAPVEEDEELEDEEEPEPEAHLEEADTGEDDLPAEDAPEDDDPDEPAARTEQHEDVLEDTPEFLEDAPEDDNLWFEQKPPKDFDFDD